MYEFTEIPWADKSLRNGAFGTRANTHVYLKGRGPHVIRCRTGNKPEQLIRLRVGGSIPGFGPQVNAVFSKKPDGSGEPLDFNNLFLSADGKDHWPARGYNARGGLGGVEFREANCALEPNEVYYMYLPEIVGGHASWEPQIAFHYASTSSDDLEDFPPVTTESPADTGFINITIQGAPFKAYPVIE